MGKQLAVAAAVTAVGVFVGMSVYGLSFEYGSTVVEWAMSLLTTTTEIEGG